MLKLDNDDNVHDCIKPQKLHQSHAIYQLDSFQSFVAIFIKVTVVDTVALATIFCQGHYGHKALIFDK